MEPALSVEELARYLAWCLETGQDMAMSEEAADRFTPVGEAPGADLSRAPIRQAGAGETPASVMAPTEDARNAALELARSAPTLAALKAAVEGFEGCALRNRATNLVFGEGDPKARILLIGETPGAEDDRSGRPFLGAPGRLLDRMLKSIGLERDKVYLTHVLPWRPPGGRPPTPMEISICLPFAERQIELVAPDLILCLGVGSARALFGVDEGILKTRGVWRDWARAGRSVRALSTLAPDHLLRQPAHKRLAWRDFRTLAQDAAKLPPRS